MKEGGEGGRAALDREVLYLAYEFPVLTQTFTANEVAGLAGAGIDLAVFSLIPSRDRAARAPSGVPVAVAPPSLSPHSVRALLAWLLRRPLRTLSLLGAVAAGAYGDQPARCWARGFAQLLTGARLAADLRAVGARPHLHAQFVDAASTVALVAARLLDLPFSVTNHTAYNPYLLREKLRHAAFFVSISEQDRRLLRRQGRGTGFGKIRVVRQGIDPDAFGRPAESAAPRRGGPVRILSVAALREKKGHHVLLAAAERLAAAGVEFELTIVGEGPERTRLEALAARPSLAGRVHLAGAEGPERVRERLHEADLFVLAAVRAQNGDTDGVPISLMEAMAAGVPVVSTWIAGIPELIRDGVDGRLARPDDPEGLARILGELFADPAARERYGAAGRARVRTDYDLADSVLRMAALIRECGRAERRPRPPAGSGRAPRSNRETAGTGSTSRTPSGGTSGPAAGGDRGRRPST